MKATIRQMTIDHAVIRICTACDALIMGHDDDALLPLAGCPRKQLDNVIGRF